MGVNGKRFVVAGWPCCCDKIKKKKFTTPITNNKRKHETYMVVLVPVYVCETHLVLFIGCV